MKELSIKVFISLVIYKGVYFLKSFTILIRINFCLKMIKKLLIGMFLWLPLLYTVLFIVISLFTGTIGGNWGFYFVGLSVSFRAKWLLFTVISA